MELWDVLDTWWLFSSSLSSAAARGCRGRKKVQAGTISSSSQLQAERFLGLDFLWPKHNKQSCLGLWFLKTSYSCHGERREFSAQWGRCTPDLHAGAPAGSAQVGLIQGKRSNILLSFPVPFLRAKWKLCLLSTQRWGIFLQCYCSTCSGIFSVCYNSSPIFLFVLATFT